MSFEIIDNTFQVIVLAAMALLAFILAFRRSSRSCLILAFGYASFMMGTLYYLLHLIILGHGPQVFYVAECSWMASYFFFSRWRSSIGRAYARRSRLCAGSWGGLCRSCHAGAGVWPFAADVRCAGAHLWHAGLPLFSALQRKNGSGLMRSHFCLKCPCRFFCSLSPSSSVITPGSAFTMLWTSC